MRPKTHAKNNLYNFVITDHLNDIKVEYRGILPDLFKEEQGAVIEGTLVNKKKILALKVVAKHDESPLKPHERLYLYTEEDGVKATAGTFALAENSPRDRLTSGMFNRLGNQNKKPINKNTADQKVVKYLRVNLQKPTLLNCSS